jgi:hypothetical protein
MDPVFQSDAEQVWSTLHEGGEQQHGILNIGDGIGTGILLGKNATSIFGG